MVIHDVNVGVSCGLCHFLSVIRKIFCCCFQLNQAIGNTAVFSNREPITIATHLLDGLNHYENNGYVEHTTWENTS